METDPLQTVENYCKGQKKSIFHVIKQYDNLLENFNILSQNWFELEDNSSDIFLNSWIFTIA